MNNEVITSREGRVATVQLNRPQTMNALDLKTRRVLLEVFDQLARDSGIGAIVLTGAGNVFCSGADLKSAAADPDSSVRRTARTLLHDIQPLLECITRMEKPVIAAVNGPAVGVGMSLALACDLLVMAEHAYLMAPFVGLGLVPDGGAAWFLTHRIGYTRAFELLVDGHKLSAARCFDLGIANRVVVDPAKLFATAVGWGARIAARPPISLALTKRLARLSLSMALSEILTVEAELQSFCSNTQDVREAVAAFGEKRPPIFHGR